MSLKVMTLATRHSTGGAQMNTYLVASKLAERDYDAQACYLFNHGEMDTDNSIPCNVICDKSASIINVIPTIVRFFIFCFKVKPNVIIGFHPLANILAVIYKILDKKVKVLATQRNPAISMSSITQPIEKQLGKAFYNKNICVSHAVKASFEDYPKTYKDKFTVIHNGINSFPIALNDKELSRNCFSLPEGYFIIGFIGRLHFQKNPLFLVDVAEHLHKKNNNIKKKFLFLIAGEGTLESEFKTLIAQRDLEQYFLFVGNLSGDFVAHFYNAIDSFIMPSLYEGFGRTIVENMLYGNPMILNDLEVTREVAGDLAYFTKLNPSYCANALLTLYEKKACGEGEGEATRIKDRATNFSISNMIDGYERQVVGG